MIINEKCYALCCAMLCCSSVDSLGMECCSTYKNYRISNNLDFCGYMPLDIRGRQFLDSEYLLCSYNHKAKQYVFDISSKIMAHAETNIPVDGDYNSLIKDVHLVYCHRIFDDKETGKDIITTLKHQAQTIAWDKIHCWVDKHGTTILIFHGFELKFLNGNTFFWDDQEKKWVEAFSQNTCTTSHCNLYFRYLNNSRHPETVAKMGFCVKCGAPVEDCTATQSSFYYFFSMFIRNRGINKLCLNILLKKYDNLAKIEDDLSKSNFELFSFAKFFSCNGVGDDVDFHPYTVYFWGEHLLSTLKKKWNV